MAVLVPNGLVLPDRLFIDPVIGDSGACVGEFRMLFLPIPLLSGLPGLVLLIGGLLLLMFVFLPALSLCPLHLLGLEGAGGAFLPQDRLRHWLLLEGPRAGSPGSEPAREPIGGFRIRCS